MGPRLGSRGKLVVTWQLAVLRLASMGPRLGSRGKISTGGGFARAYIPLQWGRDLEVAERTM